MNLETIDKLYLELAHVSDAKTFKELALEKRLKEVVDLLSSARCIAQRKGNGTAWERFDESAAKLGVSSVSARTYRILDHELPDLKEIEILSNKEIFDRLPEGPLRDVILKRMNDHA